MFKIFRVIRQRLLSENKFNKYLVYAIGEIVLVVIGIIIALQINNWNGNRKESNAELQLYSSLLDDLESEFDNIERHKNRSYRYDRLHSQIYNELNGKAEYLNKTLTLYYR